MEHYLRFKRRLTPEEMSLYPGLVTPGRVIKVDNLSFFGRVHKLNLNLTPEIRERYKKEIRDILGAEIESFEGPNFWIDGYEDEKRLLGFLTIRREKREVGLSGCVNRIKGELIIPTRRRLDSKGYSCDVWSFSDSKTSSNREERVRDGYSDLVDEITRGDGLSTEVNQDLLDRIEARKWEDHFPCN